MGLRSPFPHRILHDNQERKFPRGFHGRTRRDEHFLLGPQFTSQTTTNTAGDDPEAIAQMQLKLTETTPGLSDKDIMTMIKLVYTVPSDFKDLADICQVMAAVHELIFGAGSPLTEMLAE